MTFQTTSPSVSAVFTRRFSRSEWQHLQAPARAARFIRTIDRHLQSCASPGSTAPAWQYQLWPRELTVAIATEAVPQLTATPGFSVADLHRNLNAAIAAWLRDRELPEVTVQPIPAVP